MSAFETVPPTGKRQILAIATSLRTARSMRRTIMLLLAAPLSLSACVGGSGGFEVAHTLPEPFGFSKHGLGCYKASTVPTAEPVPDLASWYRREMPERSYTMKYEELGLRAGFQQEVCSKDLKAPNRRRRATG